MNDKVYLLKDLDDATKTAIVDAVIITKNTQSHEIKDIIAQVKSEIEYYTLEDVIKRLPGDCIVLTRDNFKSIYW